MYALTIEVRALGCPATHGTCASRSSALGNVMALRRLWRLLFPSGAAVRKVLGRMKGNIQGVIDAGGYHAKND